MTISRRNFILGATAVAGTAALDAAAEEAKAAEHDENLVLILSDIHVCGGKNPYFDMLTPFLRQLDEILALRPLPKRALVYGDVACLYGLDEDYRLAKKLLGRLEAAGISVTFTTGNHDRRSNMFAVWPEYEKRTLVPGRFVTRTSTPAADFVLLDSLRGTDTRAENDAGPGGGALDEAQQRWLAKELENLKRPTFFGAHHAMSELKVLGKPLKDLLTEHPLVPGYLHGHDHYWMPSNCAGDWRNRSPKKPLGAAGMRELCLPTTSNWGDIGYVLFRTDARISYATLVQNDYCYPGPLPPEKRPAYWDAIRDEQNGRRLAFLMLGLGSFKG